MTDAIDIATARGTVHTLWDAPSDLDPTAAVLMVGGGDGGFDGLAEALYPTLAEDFVARGMGTLRLDFRIHKFPNDPDDGAHDVIAGLEWLRGQGIEAVALVGHSFGGAVVIEAAARDASVAAVVTLATQTAGAMNVARIAPRPLLLIHGLADIRLAPRCSEMLYAMAGEPKSLVLIPDATHSLRQVRQEVRERVLEFISAALPVAPPSED
ncbi:MAG: dienelactone hydrolase family protein [Chloroflexi bacterium]|nr:dienelactone hydrolase family protein [Chloroflexota bacterium]MDA1241351.1 dienelactone hydrolase family protein [Chloroflexota bacterium]